MPSVSSRLKLLPKSAISEMSRIAEQYNAINLASGYPDYSPPVELLEAAQRTLQSDYNQYSATWGSLGFRQALVNKQRRFMGLELDADAHITVTCGGTEAVIASILAVCSPGNKVIIFSPFYENYGIGTILAGAEPVFVHLHPPEFKIDPFELRHAFQNEIKALILCNPSNPTGRVYSLDELELIARLAQEYDAFVITDEVYEHIIYDPYRHTYIASLAGMFERTISCSSLSKTYAITGWRLGYTIAPPDLTSAVRKIHDYFTICAPAPLQEAAIAGLNFPDSYYHELQAGYTRRRNLILSGIEAAGLKAIAPEGTHFVLVDISPFSYPDDMHFCRWMAKEIGVAAIPGSSFFDEPVQNLIRLSFAKSEPVLTDAVQRLQRLKEKG
jgi:aspartate/methionine/tyrosine aminotransferase